jgi:Repeat of unknown function (DUF5648)
VFLFLRIFQYFHTFPKKNRKNLETLFAHATLLYTCSKQYDLSAPSISKLPQKNFKMKNYLFLVGLFLCSILTAQNAFKHTAISSNIVNNWTVLDHAYTNNNPNAILIVTSDYGSAGPYHNKAVGVWYTNNKWTIFNQDLSAMNPNAKFNVMIASPSSNAFVHTSTTISGHVATIEHPNLNNNPNAKFLVTQNWGNSGPYNNNPYGIYYTGSKWAIFNENYAAMPANAQFNIVINSNIFVVEANVSTNYVFFDNPTTNDRPNALVFATQYWTGTYNANEIGVWYSGNRWSVYNQSIRPLPAGTKFMVLGISPATTPTTATVPLYRLYNGRDHFYTTSATEAGSSGYGAEGVAGQVYPTRRAGTVPFYRLYNAGNGDHLYTTAVPEISTASASGYRLEREEGYVFASPRAGCVPLFRLYNAGNGDHFYTTNPTERDSATRGGYVSEGIACYIFP